MKVLIILVVICVFGSALAHKLYNLGYYHRTRLQSDIEYCIEQENVSKEEATRLRQLDIENPSSNAKCFFACFFEKIGILRGNKVKMNNVFSKLYYIFGEEMANEIFDKCNDIKGTDRCDTGFKMAEAVFP